MNNHIKIIVSTILIILPLMVYKLTQNSYNEYLSSKIWHSEKHIFINPDNENIEVDGKLVTKINIDSNIKYFENFSYMQGVNVRLYDIEDSEIYHFKMFIPGKWQGNNDHLFLQSDTNQIEVIKSYSNSAPNKEVIEFLKIKTVNNFNNTLLLDFIDEKTMITTNIELSSVVWSGIDVASKN